MFILTIASVCVYEWMTMITKLQRPAPFAILGIIYILLSFVACFMIREAHSPGLGFLFVALIWSSDIGAYFTGKLVGGPKLAESISPNKTWSGYGGAMLAPAAVMLVYSIWVMATGRHGDILLGLFFGAIIGVVGQAGDLLISWFKRMVHVKDTGDIIPGHGGLLDRVDAMMLAAPVYLCLITKFSYVFGNS